MYAYCSVPNGRFAWFVTIENDGPLPVTVIGGDPGRTGDRGDEHEQLLAGGPRDVQAAGTSGHSTPEPRPDGPAQRTGLAPTTFGPGNFVEVWARYQMGNMPLMSGARMSSRSMWIRYSVLGVARTAEVPLRDGVATQGDCTSP